MRSIMNSIKMQVIEDLPLIDISQDRFGREPLVELVVDSINQVVSSNHSCLAYGIYGKWGEGKTSFMNFIKSRLVEQGKSDGINLIEFNPWLVNNEESLLREFFKAIMKTPDDTVRKALAKYGSAAILASKTIINTFVPGLGTKLADWVDLAKDAMNDSQDSLSEMKRKVSEAIEASRRHLVVMIDDVDRLDKEEMHAVLRLIRQVADFSNCIYIVAMDVDMVADSIGNYHGKGNSQDGKRFIDKIVQIPISLPRIPDCDMKQLISEELNVVLQDCICQSEILRIVESISPIICTYRDLKRYCNQISFVLPHLKDEVNVRDLCLLEVIKFISAESYNRIYESKMPLLHEVEGYYGLIDRVREHEDTEQRYQSAIEYIIIQGLDSVVKKEVHSILDELFSNTSIDDRDLERKRLRSDVYFPKYFTKSVPGDLIPDRWLDSFASSLFAKKEEEVAQQLNKWKEAYSVSEVKRAVLYLIRRIGNSDKQCKAAYLLTRAISISQLTKGIPPYLDGDPSTIPSFVAKRVVFRNAFVQDQRFAGMNVLNADGLDETLSFVFSKGEMNYCMNFLCVADDIFRKGVYEGKSSLLILIKRFSELSFKEQFGYSKLLLVTLFRYWKKVSKESFNQYATSLFKSVDIQLSTVFDKFMDGANDGQDVADFVGLFIEQISQIDKRLEDEDETVRNSRSVRLYQSNYQKLLS